jgi:hypothetical protein
MATIRAAGADRHDLAVHDAGEFVEDALAGFTRPEFV